MLAAHPLTVARWYPSEPVGEDYFERAPMRMSTEFDVGRPVEDVWSELVGEHAWEWAGPLKEARWTSPAPHGVDSTREVRTRGGFSVMHERFFVWEEGRRQAFFVERSSSPVYRRFAEDFSVEPLTAGTCRFRWKLAAEPTAVGRLLTPLNRAAVRWAMRDTRRHFQNLAKR